MLDDVESTTPRRPLTATFGLLAVASIGLTVQIFNAFFPLRRSLAVFPSVAWVRIYVPVFIALLIILQAITAAIVIVERSRTASTSLLLLFTGLLFSQLVMLSHSQSSIAVKDFPLALAPTMALLGIVMIFNMPLRDPLLPKEGISPVFSTPTVQLRTPEDDLTLWQYMIVSWMEPLIQKGVTRQMDDEDVWDLGWEFKHARLHGAFRQLQGSVTKRIFVANGMDLVRTTSLNIIRLSASKLPTSVRHVNY